MITAKCLQCNKKFSLNKQRLIDTQLCRECYRLAYPPKPRKAYEYVSKRTKYRKSLHEFEHLKWKDFNFT